MSQNSSSEIIEKVRDTVYRGALLLDDEKWDEFLDFCDDSFQYNIRTWRKFCFTVSR